MCEIMDQFDVIVIGAGVAGAAILRELSKYELRLAMLEKEEEVCFGATKGTHAILHCGFPAKGMPLKNRMELKGNLMMEQICEDLDVPYLRTGKLLVAFTEEELASLRKAFIAAKRNGVPGIELITDKKRIGAMEPNLSDEVIAAVYTPYTAVASPWGLVYGLIENAVANGARLFVNAEAQEIAADQDGVFVIGTPAGHFTAKFIVNAAGYCADKVAGLIGDHSFTIGGTRQQRIVMDKKLEGIVRHVVRDIRANGSHGDFVAPTVYGDILLGSKVEDIPEVGERGTTREGLEEWVIPRCRRLVPSLPPQMSIKPFAGYLPKGGDDYILRPSPAHARFINVVLGSSGFTSSPAAGEYVVNEVLPAAGLELKGKPDFNPLRQDIPHIRDLTDEQRAELIEKDPLYGHIVCRCETVSEGEIVEAVRRGARTRDGVKFRTRSGMGRCQGGFCGPRVLRILSRELGVPREQITRKGQGSAELLFGTKSLLKKGRGDAK